MVGMRALACFAALCGATPAAADLSITVDCARGQKIGRVLALADKVGFVPLVVRVRGTCTEDVTIERDQVTLSGDGAGAAINGAVTIDNSRGVVVASLAVTNPAGDGISVINSASAIIRGNTLSDNGGSGLAIHNGSFAQVEHNVLSRNGTSGIFLGVGCTARGSDNVMEDNRNAGIEVGDRSTYRSEGDRVTALPSGRAGLDVYRAGFADLRRASVTGLVDLNQQSQLQMRNVEGFDPSAIAGDIVVSSLSLLRLRAGVVHQGARSCATDSICIVGR